MAEGTPKANRALALIQELVDAGYEVRTTREGTTAQRRLA